MGNLFESNYSGAEFSPCRKYRYALWRVWDQTKPLVMFVGLNPSTANENTVDPTIRSVIRIASNNGYGGFYMLNCYPLVSAYPEALNDFIDTAFHDTEDLVNARWLLETARKCQDIVFAWGNFKIVQTSGRDKMLSGYFPNAKALALNKNGSPKHPLYCKKETQLIPYSYNPSSMGVTNRHDK